MLMLLGLAQFGACHLVVVSMESLSKPSQSRKLPGQSVPDCPPEEDPDEDPLLDEPDPELEPDPEEEPDDDPPLEADPEEDEETTDPELLPAPSLPLLPVR
jgi:hypothetical protein